MCDQDRTYLSLIISHRILKPLTNLCRKFSLNLSQGMYLASDTVSLRLDGRSDARLCLGDGSAQCILHVRYREP